MILVAFRLLARQMCSFLWTFSALLIPVQAVVNEDTQGNVSQLQAEVKRLKEQLSQFTSGQIIPESLLAKGRTSSLPFILGKT